MIAQPLSRLGDEYPTFPRKAPALLSRIYDHLRDRRLHHASRVVVAVLSYILTNTSTGYFAILGKSVSYKQEDIDIGPSNLDDENAEPDFISDSDDDDKGPAAHDSEDATFPTFFSSRTVATTKSSSSRLYTAIVCVFVSILPPYEKRILDAPIVLPVCWMSRSRSVDTSRFSGSSGIVATLPSNFHSGRAGSFGSCTRSAIGCCGERARTSEPRRPNAHRTGLKHSPGAC